ncbi:DUF3426 domain-containing protein [uncultured Rhodoblastus sp.]|uniref:DUF3426 domain-containing protein n=1 Tax=uncultured Rhodoblastus sp. TaxID=543037 RepID=UPI0025FAF05F|nr:DUF3426 domain-containing protein [uncultured Rhodoblastus sp.]
MHNGSLPRPRAEHDSPAVRRRPGGVACAALALVVLWSLLIGARTKILALAPVLAPAYAALGLEGHTRRLRFGPLVSRLTEEDGRLILVVEGEIRNSGGEPREAPRVRLAVLDAAGQEVYHWTAAAPQPRLGAFETAPFRARLAAPPPQGREVRARFAGAAERAGKGS